MHELESLGTEQNRKIYIRHGAGPDLFGVSFANLNQLKKQIKKDHSLARELWKTGNTDAQTLALMIADPEVVTSQELDEWLGGIHYDGLTDMLANLTRTSAHASAKRKAWIASKDEYLSRAGWSLMSLAAIHDADLDDAYFETQLATIEKKIHKAPNRTRHAMNNALIAIGMRNTRLEKLAIAAAGRIGKVEVDHGETNCVTPDAVAYIRKAKAAKKKRHGPR